MSAATASLWPSDLTLDAIRPVTILQGQAEKLGEVTNGILEGEVTTVTGQHDFVLHRLDIVAVKLQKYRHRVMTATHRGQYYPLVLDASCYRPRTPAEAREAARTKMAAVILGEDGEWPPDDWRPIVSSQEEFIKRLGEIFRSPEVRSAIESLIAKSNEADLEAGTPE